MVLSPEDRLARARARLGAARYALVDLDGTLIFGDNPAAGAHDLLEHFGERLAIVSNYSTVTAIQMSTRLASIGLSIAPERIFLAGEIAVRSLAVSHPGAKLLCVMTEPMRDLARTLGFDLVEDGAEILLVGRDLDFSYARLRAAMRAVQQGARIYASNLDRSHPGADGTPVPETGSILAAITVAAPAATVSVVGKPDPQLFEAALSALGAAPAEAIMLGDNPDTDIAGASNLCIPSISIGSLFDADSPTLIDVIPPGWRPRA